MPDSGSGTMTPVSGGVPGSAPNAYPLPYTLLSLPRFARMIGLAPLHFAGATAADLNPQVFPTGSACGDVWPRYDWQKNDQVSHESLAYAIKNAEETLADEVGYWPAPVWIAKEQLMYPRDFYRESIYQTINLRGFKKSVHTRYTRVISPGQRAVTLIGTASIIGGTLTYDDNDGDGLYETATIMMSVSTTEPCEYKVYFAGTSGQQEWEIRPARIVTISGGILTMVFESWMFIDPGLLSKYPTEDGFTAIDISTVSNFVATVEVYREYTDVSAASAVIKWENGTPGCICATCGGTGCPACSDTSQDGCIMIRDPEAGIVVPTPATYADGSWSIAAFDQCRAPDKVELYYQAGDRSNEFLRGVSCDPLSDQWAWCIIWLAISRLERPPCSCNRLKNMFDYLRQDLAESSAGVSHFLGMGDINNPFGTHRGEIMAWKHIKHHVPRHLGIAVI